MEKPIVCTNPFAKKSEFGLGKYTVVNYVVTCKWYGFAVFKFC